MSERVKQIKNMLKNSTTMPMGSAGGSEGAWMMGSAHSHSHGHDHHHKADGSCCDHDHRHHDDEDDTTNPSGGCC